MNKQHTKGNIYENGMELIFLGGIIASILFQIVLGNANILSNLMRHFSIAGMIFLVGYYSAKKPDNNRLLFTKGLFYVLLFLLVGCYHMVCLQSNPLFWSLTRLMTLLRMPENSDIFYTTSVIFLVGAALAKSMYRREFKNSVLVIICVLLLAVAFIPRTTFDYAIIGVFLGTDIYRAIPILAFTGFYFAGIFAARTDASFCRKHLMITFIITLFAAASYFTSLKKISLILLMAFPVYVTFVFVKHCEIYQKFVNILLQIPAKLSSKIQHFFFDSYGKLKKSYPVYFTLYTLCFCTLAALAFSPFLISGTSMIWNGDALSQYVPKAYYYMDYMHNLVKSFLNGNFHIPTYDFNIGFGGPVNFQTDPFYLLLALFPASMAENAYTFISIFKLYATGITASILFFYFKRSHYEALFGSLIYTFSGFALHAVVIHATFLSPMVFLPLLIIATEEVFQKKRWYLCTIFTAISLLSSFYFVYMNTITMGIYFLTRFIFTKDTSKKNIRNFFSTTCLFAGSYLLGVMIGNLSLFTSFASYLGSGRTSGAEISTESFFSYGRRLPTKFLISLISPPGNTGFSSKYGFVPLVVIAIIVLFMRNEKKILKFFFILYTAFCMFPIAGFVFSGFSNVINRWGFMYALLVSVITVCMLPKLHTLTKREIGILSLGMIPYIVIIIFDPEYSIASAPVGIIMLLVSFIVILLINENFQIIEARHTKTALFVLCAASIIVNTHLQYSIGDTSVAENFVAKGTALKEIKDTSLSAADQIEDDSFYRVAPTVIKTKNLNSSLLSDVKGVNIFASTVDNSFIDFNYEMDNSTWSMILYNGFDNRTFLNTLTNVKYVTTDELNEAFVPYGHKHIKDVEENQQKYAIYENEYALPLGYTYSDTVSEEDLEKYPSLKQQEILLQAASVADNNSSCKVAVDSIPTTSQEIELLGYEAGSGIVFGENEITITEIGAKLTLSFNALPDSETYVEYTGQCIPDEGMRDDTLIFNISRNNSTGYRYIMRTKMNTYTTNQDVFVYNLGYHEEPLTNCTIEFRNLGTFTYDSIKLYSQPMNAYPDHINVLKENVLENVAVTSNTVKGTISLDKEKLLVMAIPYQKGWTAYVDGEKTEIQKANYMFSGLFLEPGEHIIEFKYELPGIKLSLMLSGIGILIFITALFIRKKRNFK